MSAAPAYDYSSERAYERDRYAAPDISVVPGRGTRAVSDALSPSVGFLAKVAVAVLVAFVVLGVARVSLSSATVTAALETKQLTAQIEDARTDGSKLEVAQSTLSNPTRVKSAAESMGMAAPIETTKIDLSGDVVVTDEAGRLSLSGSVAVAAQSS